MRTPVELLQERIKKEVNFKLKTEYGKDEGIASRQIFALIDVIAYHLTELKLLNHKK